MARQACAQSDRRASMACATWQERTCAYMGRCCSILARRAIEAHVEDGHRDQRECCRSLPQATPALQPVRYVLRAGRRPQPSMPHHRLPAGSHLVESTAAAAAAPSNATKTAARRPSSRLPDRPKRPEQAPADDRSHRRIDAGTSRVRAQRRHGLASSPANVELPP